VDQDVYVETVRERLLGAGFKEEDPPAGSTLQARHRVIKLSRFGFIETVVVVSTIRSRPTAEDLKAFASDAVKSALVGKVRLPLGFGSGVVVYPVLLVDAIPSELTEFVRSYAPKNWAILEFPVVVNPASGELVFFEKTPMWGSAYYRTTRQVARKLLTPS
jgi:hypothetical protein